MAKRKREINMILEIEEGAGTGIKLSNSLTQKCTQLLREFSDCIAYYRISESRVGGILGNLRAPAQVRLDCTHYSHVGEVAA